MRLLTFDAYNNDDDLSYKIAIDNASNALKYCNPRETYHRINMTDGKKLLAI